MIETQTGEHVLSPTELPDIDEEAIQDDEKDRLFHELMLAADTDYKSIIEQHQMEVARFEEIERQKFETALKQKREQIDKEIVDRLRLEISRLVLKTYKPNEEEQQIEDYNQREHLQHILEYMESAERGSDYDPDGKDAESI